MKLAAKVDWAQRVSVTLVVWRHSSPQFSTDQFVFVSSSRVLGAAKSDRNSRHVKRGGGSGGVASKSSTACLSEIEPSPAQDLKVNPWAAAAAVVVVVSPDRASSAEQRSCANPSCPSPLPSSLLRSLVAVMVLVSHHPSHLDLFLPDQRRATYISDDSLPSRGERDNRTTPRVVHPLRTVSRPWWRLSSLRAAGGRRACEDLDLPDRDLPLGLASSQAVDDFSDLPPYLRHARPSSNPPQKGPRRV